MQGEQSFCGAIEQAGKVTLKCSVVKGGIEKFALKQPIFLVRRAFPPHLWSTSLTVHVPQPSPIDPLYTQQLTFEGIGAGTSVQICQVDLPKLAFPS